MATAVTTAPLPADAEAHEAATALAAVSARANADARARASDAVSQERSSSGDESVGRDERKTDGSSRGSINDGFSSNSATALLRKLNRETSPASGSAAASTDASGSKHKPHTARTAANRTALAASSAADSGDAGRSLSQSSSSAEGDNEGGSSGYGNAASADSSVPDEDTSAEGGSPPNGDGSVSVSAVAAAKQPAQAEKAKHQPAEAEDHREAGLNVRTSRRTTARRRAQHAAAAAAAASAEEETASSLDAAADGWTDGVAEKSQRASPDSPPGASSSRGLSLSCQFCHKTFSTHAHVVRHERIHTGCVTWWPRGNCNVVLFEKSISCWQFSCDVLQWTTKILIVPHPRIGRSHLNAITVASASHSVVI